MKGRFSKIFEHWNQRNTEYYQEAFEKLEKEDKVTFNFAAAFGISLWLIFRKMYGWAILVVVVSGGLKILIRMLCPPSAKYAISILFFIIFGFFGNTFYYKHVKSKVSKGYAKMPNYNPIDPICGILMAIILNFVTGMLPGVLAGTYKKQLLLMLVSSYIVVVSWAVNYVKFHSQESVEPVEVTKESVNQYLKKSSSKYLAMYFITMFLLHVLSLYAFLTMQQARKNYLMLRQSSERSEGEKITEMKTTSENKQDDFLRKAFAR